MCLASSPQTQTNQTAVTNVSWVGPIDIQVLFSFLKRKQTSSLSSIPLWWNVQCEPFVIFGLWIFPGIWIILQGVYLVTSFVDVGFWWPFPPQPLYFRIQKFWALKVFFLGLPGQNILCIHPQPHKCNCKTKWKIAKVITLEIYTPFFSFLFAARLPLSRFASPPPWLGGVVADHGLVS